MWHQSKQHSLLAGSCAAVRLPARSICTTQRLPLVARAAAPLDAGCWPRQALPETAALRCPVWQPRQRATSASGGCGGGACNPAAQRRHAGTWRPCRWSRQAAKPAAEAGAAAAAPVAARGQGGAELPGVAGLPAELVRPGDAAGEPYRNASVPGLGRGGRGVLLLPVHQTPLLLAPVQAAATGAEVSLRPQATVSAGADSRRGACRYARSAPGSQPASATAAQGGVLSAG